MRRALPQGHSAVGAVRDNAREGAGVRELSTAFDDLVRAPADSDRTLLLLWRTPM